MSRTKFKEEQNEKRLLSMLEDSKKVSDDRPDLRENNKRRLTSK
jgi:hypothetical protein